MKAQTKDATLAYFVNQLDNMDKTLHEPLFSITWGRDIKLRTGITMAQESTSFLRNKFGTVGSQKADGMPWVNPNSSTLPGVSINGERIVLPLRLLARELSWTSVELERGQLTGQPIDVQKFNALKNSYDLNTDEIVYIGSTESNQTGLLNDAGVVVGPVVTGSGGFTFVLKTHDEILLDVNEILETAYTASGFAVCPDKLLLPPVQFSLLVARKVSDAGNISILEYIRQNSLCLAINGRPLDIQPCKWLTGRGAAGTDRMMAYTNDQERVRFPMVPIRRETPYNHGLQFNSPYLWAFGEVEFVYPETALYRDKI